MALFVTDTGGFYEITVDGNITSVRGVRSDVTYTSESNAVEIKGKYRKHTGVGVGQRAVLHLDTGEGMSRISGVYRADA